MTDAMQKTLIMMDLTRLIEQARAEKKWLWCRYQDMWFHPDELQKEIAHDRFVWGAVNWTLRDPQERLKEANDRLLAATFERNRIAEEIKRP